MIVLVGLCMGVFNVLLGLGGGAIAIPSLTTWFDFSLKQAVSTSLLAVACLTTVSFFVFQKKSKARLKGFFLYFLGFFALGSVLGAQMNFLLSEEALKMPVSFTFLLMALALLRTKRFQRKQSKRGFFCVLFLFAGTLVGLTGLGGGLFVSFLLFYLVDHKDIPPLTVGFVAVASWIATGLHFQFYRDSLHVPSAVQLWASALVAVAVLFPYRHVVTESLRKGILVVLLMLLGLRMAFF